MSTLRKRLLSGAGAYGYAQVVTIVTQLTGVPIFLSFWDMEIYGTWLILCAAPIYIAIADFGIATIAGNKMTMLYADKKFTEANVVFQSSLFMCSIILVFLSLFSICIAVAYQVLASVKFEHMIALLMLVFAALLALIGNLFDALFKSVGKYALGTVLVTTSRLMEWLFSIAGVAFWGSIEAAALGFLIGRIFMTLVNWFISVRTVNVYQWSFKNSSNVQIRTLLKPSLAFMAFPLGNAINLQGITMLIGLVLGPTAVVVYNTYRTVSRILVQSVQLVTKPIWPELSAAFGSRDRLKVKQLVRVMSLYSFGFTFLGSILLYYFGDLLISSWTMGQVKFYEDVYFCVLAAALASACSQIFITLIVSTNNHINFCKFYIFSSVVNFIGIYIFREHFGLFGIATLMFIVECAFLGAAYWFSAKIKIEGASA